MTIELIFSRHSDAAEALVEGYYRWERAGCVPVPIRIWWGPPLDPEQDPQLGIELDRSPRWNVLVDGYPLEAPGTPKLEWFWPGIQNTPTRRGDYEYLLDRARHDRIHDPNSPFAQANRKVDLLSATIPGIGD